MSEDFENWYPMSDDFNSKVFNSYGRGQTGQHMPLNLGGETGSPPMLYIDGFPSDLTEFGIKNFLNLNRCKCSSVKIVYDKQCRRHSLVEFESKSLAQKAIEIIENQRTYRLKARFASTQKDLKNKALIKEREKQEFLRLLNKQNNMKPKIDIGNCSAINSETNGNTSVSPIQSESGSQDSSLDILSPLAKSDKLLKILEKPGDECSFCQESQSIEHMHFILSEQQVVDPTLMPELIPVTNTCDGCGNKGVDMKLCSQCKTVIYCNRNCQSLHWFRHRLNCVRINSNESLRLNSTLKSNKTEKANTSNVVINGETLETAKPVIKETAKPVVKETAKPVIKESLPVVPQSLIPPKVMPITTTQNIIKTSPLTQKVKVIEDHIVKETPLSKTTAIEPLIESKDKVQPNKENNKMKITPITEITNVVNEQLIDGEKDVILCFGRNPFDFYIQKSSAADSMDLFADEMFNKMHDFPLIPENELKKGTLCGGIYSADGNCYRAQIVNKVDDKTFALYFIDYGNTEAVDKKNIKRLPQLYFSCKAQAIHCCLDGITPRPNQWSKDAIHFFGDIGETNEYSKVKLISKTDDIYKIDLINKNGESLSQKLIEKGFAQNSNDLSESPVRPAVPSPSKVERSQTPVRSNDSPVVVQNSPKVTFNKASIDVVTPNFVQSMPTLDDKSNTYLKSYLENIKTNSAMVIVVAQPFDAEEFIYFGMICSEPIEELFKTLSDDYNLEKQSVIPEEGDIVVAQDSENSFNRAVVLEIEGRNVKVFMFDSGFIEGVTRDRIFKLNDNCSKYEVMGVVILPKDKASARILEVMHTTEGSIEGILTKESGKLYLKNENNSYEILDFQSSLDYIKKNHRKVTKEEETPEEAYLKLPLRELQKSVETIVLYQDLNDFKTFYVTSDGDDLTKVMNLCANYSQKYSDNIKVNPLLSNVYLVRSEADGEWYRAFVNSVDGDTINVKYIDFGNEEEVGNKFVLELSDIINVTTIKPLAIKCKVESTKLSDEELNAKITKAADGSFLLKMEIIGYEKGIHLVKVL